MCIRDRINIQEKITLTNNNLTISAGGYTSEIDVNDITELKLLDDIKPPTCSLRPIIPDNARHLRITAAAGT